MARPKKILEDGSLEAQDFGDDSPVADTPNEKPKMSLMERFFDMIIGVLSLKVQSIAVHQAVNVHGMVKATVDCDQAKCKMFMCPFGVVLISNHPAHKKEFKRLITFNNIYEIHFAV